MHVQVKLKESRPQTTCTRIVPVLDPRPAHILLTGKLAELCGLGWPASVRGLGVQASNLLKVQHCSWRDIVMLVYMRLGGRLVVIGTRSRVVVVTGVLKVTH